MEEYLTKNSMDCFDFTSNYIFCRPRRYWKKFFIYRLRYFRNFIQAKKQINYHKTYCRGRGKLRLFALGTFEDKVAPYLLPLYDSIGKAIGYDGPQRERIDTCLEIAPLAFLRGRTFENAVCILDEAQNATAAQLKMFLTRMGENSVLVINGDPTQSDIRSDESALLNVVAKLETVGDIAIVKFDKSAIVRHPLVAKILDKLE
jgi:hypothetical protein